MIKETKIAPEDKRGYCQKYSRTVWSCWLCTDAIPLSTRMTIELLRRKFNEGIELECNFCGYFKPEKITVLDAVIR